MKKFTVIISFRDAKGVLLIRTETVWAKSFAKAHSHAMSLCAGLIDPCIVSISVTIKPFVVC